MAKRIALGLVVAAGLSWGSLARSAAPPQPMPEQTRLQAFVGKWRVETDFKALAGKPASKAIGTEDCEWYANLHLICRLESTGPSGLYKSLRLMSYSPALKKYSVYTVDSVGYTAYSLGSLNGSTWTFSSEVGALKTQLTVKTSDDTIEATSQYAGVDGKWVTPATMKATRVSR